MAKKETTKLLRIGQLAKETGKRQSTLSWYSDLGILPSLTRDGKAYSEQDTRLGRYYDLAEFTAAWREIESLKKKNFTIPEIVEKLSKKKTTGGADCQVPSV